MCSILTRYALVGSLLGAAIGGTRAVQAQTFGLELHNNLMPATGGMGGVSIAQPQDLTSGLKGNPASLTQFAGTQFSFGGAWAESTFNMNQSEPILALDVARYSAKSTAPGVPIGNIGLTQDLRELGVPATFALGFVTTSGVFGDFRQLPASNATNPAGLPGGSFGFSLHPPATPITPRSSAAASPPPTNAEGSGGGARGSSENRETPRGKPAGISFHSAIHNGKTRQTLAYASGDDRLVNHPL